MQLIRDRRKIFFEREFGTRGEERFMIPFIDLPSQQKKLEKPLKEAIDRVLTHGQYILGPEKN